MQETIKQLDELISGSTAALLSALQGSAEPVDPAEAAAAAASIESLTNARVALGGQPRSSITAEGLAKMFYGASVIVARRASLDGQLLPSWTDLPDTERDKLIAAFELVLRSL
jgi:hypothetical protein